MKHWLWVAVCVLIALSTAILPAMAEGTLASPGDGLVDYYMGMPKSRVKVVAPMFKDLGNDNDGTNAYLLDFVYLDSDDEFGVTLIVGIQNDVVESVQLGLYTDKDLFQSRASTRIVNQMIALCLAPYTGITFDWLNDCEEYGIHLYCASEEYTGLFNAGDDGIYAGLFHSNE